MSTNVAQAVESNAKTLFEKLSENQDLSNVLMGFLGRIILSCQQMGKPIQGVEMGTVTENGGDFRFPISFNTLMISPPTLWTAASGNDFTDYVKARSQSMARALEANVRLVAGFRELVMVIDKFCERKRMPFADFKVKKAFITRDNKTCVLKSGTENLDRWGR
jgi:hypothetical protein